MRLFYHTYATNNVAKVENQIKGTFSIKMYGKKVLKLLILRQFLGKAI